MTEGKHARGHPPQSTAGQAVREPADEARKRAEEVQPAHELWTREVADSIPVGIALLTPDGEIEIVNKELCEYFGKTMEELKGWGLGHEVHSEDLPRVLAATTESLVTGQPFDVEQRLRRHDGVYRWFQVRALPHRDAAGRTVRWYVVEIDIDDRKRAEDALRARERELDQIINAMPALAWSAHPDGTAAFLNQSYLDYVGCSLAEVGERGWGAAVHPEDLKTLDLIWAADALGTVPVVEARLRRADGEYRWFLFRASSFKDEQGKLIKWYGVSTDIEELKRAEAELRRSQTLLAAGQELSLTGSFSWRLDTDELVFSEELYRIFGLDPDVPVTHALIGERVHPDDHETLAKSTQGLRGAAQDSDCWHRLTPGDLRLVMPDGELKFIQSKGRVIRHQDGRLEYVGAIQDVTRHRHAEGALDHVRSELAHAARAMSLGLLTASIAHELNQPLSGIITNANICQRLLGADPPNVEGALETTRRTVRDGHRAADVISRLRALFGKKEFAAEAVDMNQATRDVIALSAHELQRRQVALRVELEEELPEVIGDRVQLQQVILNLLLNACDAMKAVTDRPREIFIKTAQDNAGAVHVTVRDTGIGLPQEAVEKLFESFYTTKPDGMGIGLSVSRSIIERHEGRLWASHNDGPGAAFSFWIPSLR